MFQKTITRYQICVNDSPLFLFEDFAKAYREFNALRKKNDDKLNNKVVLFEQLVEKIPILSDFSSDETFSLVLESKILARSP